MDHDGPNNRLMRVMQWRGAFTLKLLVELPAAKPKKSRLQREAGIPEI
jgi:hypothetical protein